ncbi:sensor histidine kinase [Sporosarcina highlanderae]|uniref:histidine kinase n=1 Tax=Sporosarcina highlanderae TaxID=3035916 RepID=A0ABT8JUU4_9BACL|nr:ATP-binding protein [Sporosarcina highlanderae]MDN4608147.1 histidine kinase [Sporosarcina highlanderae]
MNWINRIKINQKILGSIIASLLFLSLILGIIIWNSLTDTMAKDLKKHGESVAENIAAMSSDYILIEDYYAIHQLIARARQANEDIRYILVFNSKQMLVGHTFPDFIPKGILDAHTPQGTEKELSILTSDEGRIHDVLVPIEEGEVGFVRVGMSEKLPKEYTLSKIGDLILATILVCLVAVGIAYFTTRIITKPINDLVDTASGISAGNLSLRASVVDDEDLGKLVKVFNEMADNLISSRSKVEKLLEELQEKERLRDALISKLLSAQEDERKRISRELHDETSQALASLMVTMRVLADEAEDKEQQELLYTSRDIAAGILREIRDLAVELRPPILDDMGLIPAVKRYIESFKEKYSIDVMLEVPDDSIPLDDQTSLAFYRITQECLTNIAKHTVATKVTIKIQVEDNFIKIAILDNGQGIQKADFEMARQQNRIGIYGMKERAALLGGEFLIQEARTGGTEVVVAIPIKQKEG